MNTNPSSPSHRLAELNSQILQLESERVELLRQELANAAARSAEVSSFIGVYHSSSSTTPADSPTRPTSSGKGKRKSKGGREKSAKAQVAPRTKASGGKASSADRLDQAIAIVKGAGAGGISAKQLSEKANIPYGAVRKILSESGRFRQEGEKRASRIFLK